MRNRDIHYLLTTIILFFILTGCGNTSSSDTQERHNSITNEENIAMLIPRENLQSKGKYSTTKASLSLNTFSKIIKEEGDAGVENWIVYDKSPAGATITQLDYGYTGAIQLQGDGLKNGYVLGYWTEQGAWHDQEHKSIQWSMNYSEDYYVYVRVSTPKGYRYLYYTPDDHNYGIAKFYDAPHYIHHGLGSSSTDGTWKTFSRNLEADLKEFEPDNSISTVDGFFVRGSGLIDDIILLKEEESLSPLKLAILAWIKKNKFLKLSEDINKVIIDSANARAVIHLSLNYAFSDNLYILDISDLNNIKKLNMVMFSDRNYPFTYPEKVQIKTDDYILIALAHHIILYDYKTGENLSFSDRMGKLATIEYKHIGVNYAIYSDIILNRDKTLNKILAQIDFTDRRNPLTTILYNGVFSNDYQLSSDESKIFVKETDGNVIEEIPIN